MERACRFCRGTTGVLISPCACEGSIGYSHPCCAVQWVCQKKSLQCELCRKPYKICGVKNRKVSREITAPIASVSGVLVWSRRLSFLACKLASFAVKQFAPIVLEKVLFPLFNGWLLYAFNKKPFTVFKEEPTLPVPALLASQCILGSVLMAVYDRILVAYDSWRGALFLPRPPPRVVEEEEEFAYDGAAEFLLPRDETDSEATSEGVDEATIVAVLSQKLQNMKGTNPTEPYVSAIRKEFSYIVIHILLCLVVLFPKALMIAISRFGSAFDLTSSLHVDDQVLAMISVVSLEANRFLLFMMVLSIGTKILCGAILRLCLTFDKQAVLVGVTFVRGVVLACCFGYFTVVAVGSTVTLVNWKFIYASESLFTQKTAYRFLESEGILPIKCSGDVHTIGSPVVIKAALSLLFNGVADDDQCLNVFDPSTCPNAVTLPPYLLPWAFGLAIASRFDLATCAFFAVSLASTISIFWSNVVSCSLIWSLKNFSLDWLQNWCCRWIANPPMGSSIVFLLKAVVVTLFTEGVVGVQIRRLATLTVPGALEINMSLYDPTVLSTTEATLILVRGLLASGWFPLLFRIFHSTVRYYLLRMCDVIEDIDEELVGHWGRVLLYRVIHGCITACLIIALSTRVYVTYRRIDDVDFIFHVVVILGYGVPNVLYPYFIVPAVQSSRKWFCQWFLLSRFGLTSHVSGDGNATVYQLNTDLHSCRKLLECQVFHCDELFLRCVRDHRKATISRRQVEDLVKDSFSLPSQVYPWVTHLTGIICLMLLPYVAPIVNPSSTINGWKYYCLQLSPAAHYAATYAMNYSLLLLVMKLEFMLARAKLFFSIDASQIFFSCDRTAIGNFCLFSLSRGLGLKAAVALFRQHDSFTLWDSAVHATLLLTLILLVVFTGPHVIFSSNPSHRIRPRPPVEVNRQQEQPLSLFKQCFSILTHILMEYVRGVQRWLHAAVSESDTPLVYFSNCD